ncbi:hypothetical protein HK100_009621 [Physocladia obscura]|uniref:Uncharacterized protein n=1 Tax=Physocladia obscura TaxID=109957 RepID=A0AAD5XHN1_9FUNG|nr:hypothetical protein HK100_009621 [Physocladia obscura]
METENVWGNDGGGGNAFENLVRANVNNGFGIDSKAGNGGNNNAEELISNNDQHLKHNLEFDVNSSSHPVVLEESDPSSLSIDRAEIVATTVDSKVSLPGEAVDSAVIAVIVNDNNRINNDISDDNKKINIDNDSKLTTNDIEDDDDKFGGFGSADPIVVVESDLTSAAVAVQQTVASESVIDDDDDFGDFGDFGDVPPPAAVSPVSNTVPGLELFDTPNDFERVRNNLAKMLATLPPAVMESSLQFAAALCSTIPLPNPTAAATKFNKPLIVAIAENNLKNSNNSNNDNDNNNASVALPENSPISGSVEKLFVPNPELRGSGDDDNDGSVGDEDNEWIAIWNNLALPDSNVADAYSGNVLLNFRWKKSAVKNEFLKALGFDEKKLEIETANSAPFESTVVNADVMSIPQNLTLATVNFENQKTVTATAVLTTGADVELGQVKEFSAIDSRLQDIEDAKACCRITEGEEIRKMATEDLTQLVQKLARSQLKLQEQSNYWLDAKEQLLMDAEMHNKMIASLVQYATQGSKGSGMLFLNSGGWLSADGASSLDAEKEKEKERQRRVVRTYKDLVMFETRLRWHTLRQNAQRRSALGLLVALTLTALAALYSLSLSSTPTTESASEEARVALYVFCAASLGIVLMFVLGVYRRRIADPTRFVPRLNSVLKHFSLELANNSASEPDLLFSRKIPVSFADGYAQYRDKLRRMN